jgi:hypothetical protein
MDEAQAKQQQHPCGVLKMKLYTFLDENENILTEVRAENHDEAVNAANGWTDYGIDYHTDFYSETIED